MDLDRCRKLSAAFYARVDRDPILRAVYPPSHHCAVESLALFLAQFLGGPCDYAKQRWSLSLREAHLRFRIGRKEREAWMRTMGAALDDVHIEDPARSALHNFFEHASAYLVNQGEPVTCPARMVPDFGKRWDVQRRIEEIVAAVRKGNVTQAIALAEDSEVQNYFKRDRGAFLSMLAIMSGTAGMIDYVTQRILNDPGCAAERYTYGRTLLYEVAGAGGLEIVKLLLRLGADPNATDGFGHPILYHVGNGCNVGSGPRVVRALVVAGANVDAREPLKHCTALHMAARRGNIPIGEALLNCGADLEARDKLGDTPLRRAVNCGKSEMVAFLLSRGADVSSKGSKGLAPWQVARGDAMKNVLQRPAATKRD
jgi:truncated hemoglobin YjbI